MPLIIQRIMESDKNRLPAFAQEYEKIERRVKKRVEICIQACLDYRRFDDFLGAIAKVKDNKNRRKLRMLIANLPESKSNSLFSISDEELLRISKLNLAAEPDEDEDEDEDEDDDFDDDEDEDEDDDDDDLDDDDDEDEDDYDEEPEDDDEDDDDDDEDEEDETY